MSRRKSNFRYRLEQAYLVILREFFLLFPADFSFRAGSFLYRILSSVLPFRKKTIRENLKTAFPDMEESRIREITTATYENLFVFSMEFVHLGKWDKQKIAKRIAEIEGEEYFLNFSKSGDPYIAVTGHIGNWELMGAYFASCRDVPVAVVAKPLHNPYVEEMVNNVRTKNGMEVISTREDAAKDILKALRKGKNVVFLADQDARRSGIFVDFFGKKASTFPGPALFAIRSGCPILPVFDIRMKNYRHKIIFYPPIYPTGVSKNREEAVEEITRRHVGVLEDVIRRYPEQYFWFHKRWKTEPPG